MVTVGLISKVLRPGRSSPLASKLVVKLTTCVVVNVLV
jgi:hypothetical protein